MNNSIKKTQRSKKIILGKQYEKELRKNITPAEKHFKELVKKIKKEYNLKFTMSFQKGWYKDEAFYISDFYFPATKCSIELDGSSHQDPKQIIQDKNKSEYLKFIGVSTLRISNQQCYSMDTTRLFELLTRKGII